MPRELASKFKIVTADESEFQSLWQKGLEEFSDTSPFYSESVRSYDRLYIGDSLIQDDSCVLIDGQGKIVALLPLLLTKNGNVREYSIHSSWQWGPLFTDQCGESKREELFHVLVEYIETCAKKQNVQVHRMKLSCPTVLKGMIAYNILREQGYTEENQIGLVLRLDKGEKELWSGIRDSYRPLINRANRTYQTYIVTKDTYTHEACEEYRILHRLAAGRETRPKETFEAMYQMIQDGCAYLVLVREGDHTRGAYFFYIFRDTAFYASAATDPAILPSSGVGHLGLWKGIEEARSRDCMYLDFGLFSEVLTEKEKNIEFFKLGFGGQKVITFCATKKFE